MTDLADAVGNLLTADLPVENAPDAGTCRWCGQEWTASQTTSCRHFSPGAGHCPDCGRQWTGSREAHCPACHRHFSSDGAFDMHQRLDHDPCKGHPKSRCYARLVCRDPKTLTTADGSPRLVEVETPDGPMWAHPGTRPPESIPERSAP